MDKESRFSWRDLFWIIALGFAAWVATTTTGIQQDIASLKAQVTDLREEVSALVREQRQHDQDADAIYRGFAP